MKVFLSLARPDLGIIVAKRWAVVRNGGHVCAGFIGAAGILCESGIPFPLGRFYSRFSHCQAFRHRDVGIDRCQEPPRFHVVCIMPLLFGMECELTSLFRECRWNEYCVLF